MTKARVHKSDRREFICKLTEEQEFVTATALGNLLKTSDIVVGDYLKLEKESNEWKIVEVLPRENEIYRVIVRERKKKATAANIDYMLIFSSVSKPKYKKGLVDRYLVRAHQWDVKPLVIFNKMDQYDKSFDLDFEIKKYESFGIPCFTISALNEFQNKEYDGSFGARSFKELTELLQNTTSIFLGQSGVGKSKTISALTEGRVELLSEKIAKVGKGAHTTTWTEIIEDKNLTLVDSPGIRSYSLEDLTPMELIDYFPPLAKIAVYCKFSDCKHVDKSHKCAFYDDEHYENEEQKSFVLDQLSTYHKIYTELAKTPDWQRAKDNS